MSFLCLFVTIARDGSGRLRFNHAPMKALVAIFLAVSTASLPASVEESIRALTAVEGEGRGNETAGTAWRDVVKAGPAALPDLLSAAGMGGPVADNWVRLACDA